MSTKITLKRIALVAVSALGFGLVSGVPANASASGSFTLQKSSITVVGSSSPAAVFQIKINSSDSTDTSHSLASGETLTVTITGGGRDATPSKTLAEVQDDLTLTEVTVGTEGQAYSTATADSGNDAEAESDTDGTIGSNNTDADCTDESDALDNCVYLKVTEASAGTALDQGEYTLRFRLTNSSGVVIDEETAYVKFVSSAADSGAAITLAKAGQFYSGTAIAYTTTNYLKATLTDARGGQIVVAGGTAPDLTLDFLDADGAVTTAPGGTPTEYDNGTDAQDFGVATDGATNGTLKTLDGVYGINWTPAAAVTAASQTVLRARYGAGSGTLAIVVNAALSTSYDETAAAVSGTGVVLTSTANYAVPLTTTSTTASVQVLDGSTAGANIPMTFTVTWTNCASSDQTPRSGATYAKTVLTDAEGIASTTVACAAPVAGTSASVAITGTSGDNPAAQVITWRGNTPWTVSADPAGPMDAKLESTTSVTFTVRDAFGALVPNAVMNLSLSGANNAAGTVLIPSKTTDANGQVSHSFTDAAAEAADEDTLTATSRDVSSATASVVITYRAALTVPSSVNYYYSTTDKDASMTTIVTSTPIYESGSTGWDINTSKNIAKSLTPATSSTSDDVLGLSATFLTSGSLAATGLPVTVTASTGGWILSSAGLPVSTRTIYTNSSGIVNFNVTATTPGVKEFTVTQGTVTKTAKIAFINETADARFLTVTAGSNNSTATAGSDTLPSWTAVVTDNLGNPVSGVTIQVTTTGVGTLASGAKSAQWTTLADGSYTFEMKSSEAGVSNITVSASASGSQLTDAAGFAGTTVVSGIAAGVSSATSSVTFAAGTSASQSAAEAASDAALEAIDAANAATDAANLAAEAADAATVAAEEARDAADAATAAVEALASEVATLMAALKAQITTLAKTVAKIAKKVKA